MERIFDFPNVKERPELPDGVFDFAVEGITEGQTQKAKLAALRVTMRVIGSQGDACTNLPWGEMFLLGSEGDPDGTDPQKVNDAPGIRGLKRLARACDLDVGQRWSQQQLIAGILANPRFTGHIQKKERKNEKGVFDSNIDRFYKYQEVPVKLDGPAQPSRTAGATAARPNGPAGPTTTATAAVRPAAPVLPAGFSVEE